MNSNNLDSIIQSVKKILTAEGAEEALRFLEGKTMELEKNNEILESLILWQFFSETLENIDEEGEEENLAYAYSKLITRYLFTDEIEKAKAIYSKADNQKLNNFHINLAKRIFDNRMSKPDKKEIVEIQKEDIFGDYVSIVGSPVIYFESLGEIKNYIETNFPKGTYKIKTYNHRSNSADDFVNSTENREEYEVISKTEIVRLE